VEGSPQGDAAVCGLVTEATMHTAVFGYRVPYVVLPVRRDRFFCLLSLVAVAGKDMVGIGGTDFVTDDSLIGAGAHPDRSAVVRGGIEDGIRGHFRLIDLAHRPGFIGQPVEHPAKLGCIHCRQLDHAGPDIAFIVQKLAS